MTVDLQQWSMPANLLESLSSGQRVEDALGDAKSSFVQFLVKTANVPETVASQAADALMGRIIAALARGDDPETAVAWAQQGMDKTLAQLVPVDQQAGQVLATALAQGGAQAADEIAHVVAQAGDGPGTREIILDTLRTALSAGSDPATAAEQALAAVRAADAVKASGAVPLGIGDTLIGKLAEGGPTVEAELAAVTAGMPPEQVAAYVKGLLDSLMDGGQSGAALAAAAAGAAAQARIAADQSVPVSQADALIQALASGTHAQQALADAGYAGNSGAAQALEAALAGGAGGANAVDAAHAATQAESQAAELTATSGGSALAAALAGGGEAAGAVLAAAGATDGSAFAGALGQALAGGASPEAAAAVAAASDAAAQSQQEAAAVDPTAGAALALALASGENLEQALAAAGLSGDGSQAAAMTESLAQALAQGQDPTGALAAAAAAGEAAGQQVAAAQEGVPPADPQLAALASGAGSETAPAGETTPASTGPASGAESASAATAPPASGPTPEGEPQAPPATTQTAAAGQPTAPETATASASGTTGDVNGVVTSEVQTTGTAAFAAPSSGSETGETPAVGPDLPAPLTDIGRTLPATDQGGVVATTPPPEDSGTGGTPGGSPPVSPPSPGPGPSTEPLSVGPPDESGSGAPSSPTSPTSPSSPSPSASSPPSTPASGAAPTVDDQDAVAFGGPTSNHPTAVVTKFTEAPVLNPGVTVDAWVNTDVYPGSIAVIVDDMTYSNGTITYPGTDIIARRGATMSGFKLSETSTGKIDFEIAQNGEDHTITSTTAIDDGNWHNVGASYDASSGQASIYVDGVADVISQYTTTYRDGPVTQSLSQEPSPSSVVITGNTTGVGSTNGVANASPITGDKTIMIGDDKSTTTLTVPAAGSGTTTPGSSQATDTSTPAVSNVHLSTRDFSGAITDVQVWNSPATASTIQTDMSHQLSGNASTESGLILSSPLNSTSAPVISQTNSLVGSTQALNTSTISLAPADVTTSTTPGSSVYQGLVLGTSATDAALTYGTPTVTHGTPPVPDPTASVTPDASAVSGGPVVANAYTYVAPTSPTTDIITTPVTDTASHLTTDATVSVPVT